MVTYPSTHGVFEEAITEICKVVHEHGGQVYLDGANMNAMVGLCRPGDIGADVCHLNLHKTFCIPHGGGGPGMGPIGVAKHLAPFLPGPRGDPDRRREGDRRGQRGAVGQREHPAHLADVHHDDGRRGPHARHEDRDPQRQLRRPAARAALPRALQGQERHDRARVHRRSARPQGRIGRRGRGHRQAAHGLRLPRADDLVPGARHADDRADRERIEGRARPLRRGAGRDPRRDRRDREGHVAQERQPAQARAAHARGGGRPTAWSHAYSRERAAFPLPWVRERKFWPAVGRVDNAYGDRNLVCSCPPIEEYAAV